MRYIFLALLFPVFCYADSFEDVLLSAKEKMNTEDGKVYEEIVRVSTWGVDSDCFHDAAESSEGAIGYYQLAATIKLDGTVSYVDVKPRHIYSQCVKTWFSSNIFEKPPADKWPIHLEVNVQP